MAATNEVKFCAIPHCGQLARPNGRTCSPACAQLWKRVYRYSVDREAHAINQANTILRSPDKYPKARVDWAERVLGVVLPPK